MTKRRTLLVASLLALPLPARAASFDCKKAATAIEKLICSDAGLSKLDGELADAYRRALAVADHADELKAEQRSWLATERAKCADVACLRESCQQRLVALSRLATAGFEAPAGAGASYSFSKAPFINPRLVEDLSTSEADHGDQVIAINVDDSQRSNRYFGEPEVQKVAGEKNPYVFNRTEDAEFGYRYLGRTTSGVDVLVTRSSGGGSGIFGSLMLVTLRLESSGMTPEDVLDSQTLSFTRRRLVLKKLGEIGLSDRWQGELAIKGNEIVIGANVAPLPGDDGGRRRVIKVDFP